MLQRWCNRATAQFSQPWHRNSSIRKQDACTTTNAATAARKAMSCPKGRRPLFNETLAQESRNANFAQLLAAAGVIGQAGYASGTS
jgi:hypothetical protein